jgi:hypothetical protein
MAFGLCSFSCACIVLLETFGIAMVGFFITAEYCFIGVQDWEARSLLLYSYTHCINVRSIWDSGFVPPDRIVDLRC